MATVVLVGAGATLAEALPKKPARERTPPLDATFFGLCEAAALDGLTVVREYMTRNFGIDPTDGTHRMEEVFNHIYSDAYRSPPERGALNAYWALLRMYQAALAVSTNPLDGNSRFGVGALLRLLWRYGGDRDISFVTFNQDLVIEKAIQTNVEKRRYSEIPWDLELCYGRAFQAIHWMNNNPDPFSEGGGDSLSVIKLHGSMNWIYNVRSGEDPRNSVRRPNSPLVCLNHHRIALRPTTKVRRRTMTQIPLVVPPIFEKASQFRQAMGPLWRRASSLFESADTLIVFGYSFPGADFAARSLMRRAFHRNARLNEVTIIDPDPMAGSRIAALLETDCLHQYSSVPRFGTAIQPTEEK